MKFFSQKDFNPKILKSSSQKIGLISLSTDFTIEKDFHTICHGLNVDIYVNRIPFNNPLNKENYLKMLDHLPEVAKNILPGEHIDSIAYGCTSGSVAIGSNRIKKEIHKSKSGSYVTTPITAVLKAFKNLKINKIAVLTPYPKEVNKTIFDYLVKNNIEITSFTSFNLQYDNKIASVDPNYLIEAVEKINDKNAEAIFISCTALRAVEVISEIENSISKIVVSSNQAMIWDCLRSIGVNKSISGFGKLLSV